ncbi:MAG TPA: T9SS type A sorting domain-containing protein [Bacteroidia bacterium]|nr:T9SS type A sorting domain-containing protein [Bacteroidia bacterium]
MKNYIFLNLSLLFTLTSVAQITITSADMPDVNDSLYVSTTLSVGTHNPAETGANFNWDYADLKPALQLSQKFVGPTKFPSIYSFLFNSFNTSYGKNNPLLTSLPIPGVNITVAYDFYKESAASLNQVGVGFEINEIPLPFIYKHPDFIYRFPMEYLKTDSCNFDFGLAVPGYGYYGQKGHRHNIVDGWGQLTTPFGTFSTLRILSLVDITDTLYLESDSIGVPFKRPLKYEYKWLAAGSKIPVLQIDGMLVSNQPVYTATFIDSLRKDVIHVGIDETSKEDPGATVYPNPARDQFRLSYQVNEKSLVTITVMDMLGKEVLQAFNEIQPAGTHDQIINVSALPSGIYFVKVGTGTSASVQKISVVH